MEQPDLLLELQQSITAMETKHTAEGMEVRQCFRDVVESIKPINIIKNTFNDVVESVELKDNIVNTAVGVSAGYLSKKLVEGGSKNIFKRLLGTAVMFGITSFVSKNPDTIKTWGNSLLDLTGLTDKRKEIQSEDK